MTFATSSTSPLELSCTTAPGSPCLQRCHSTAPARNSTLGSLLSLFRTTSVRGLPFPVPPRGFSGGLLTCGAALFWKAGAGWCLLAGREALKKGGTPLGGVARGTLAVTWHLGLPGQCWERTGRHKQRGWCPRGEGNLCPQSKAAEMETSTSPSTHQKALMWPSLLLSCCGGSKTPPHTLRVAFLAIFFFLRELRNSSREGNISVNITAVLLMPSGLVQPSQGIKLTPRTLTELLPHKRPQSSVSYC